MTAPDPHPVVAHCIASGYYGVPLPARTPRLLLTIAVRAYDLARRPRKDPTVTIPDLTKCVTCGDPEVEVIVCDHVLNGNVGGPEITVNLGVSREDIPRHECDQDCGENALCSGCWSNL